MKKWIFALIGFAPFFTVRPHSSFAYAYGDNPKWYSGDFTWNYRDLSSTYREGTNDEFEFG